VSIGSGFDSAGSLDMRGMPTPCRFTCCEHHRCGKAPGTRARKTLALAIPSQIDNRSEVKRRHNIKVGWRCIQMLAGPVQHPRRHMCATPGSISAIVTKVVDAFKVENAIHHDPAIQSKCDHTSSINAVDNNSQIGQGPVMTLRLDQLAIGQSAVISRLDPSLLGEVALRRLRAMGFSEGTKVEPVHRGILFGHDPIAVRAGRMTLAIRAAQAAAIEVELT
jgi:ferrous iron transport protein A